MTVQNVILK